jgi:hypothetical protein
MGFFLVAAAVAIAGGLGVSPVLSGLLGARDDSPDAHSR